MGQAQSIPVPGAKGDKGDKGIDGINGRDGINGINGKDGKDGRNGIDGQKGEKGDTGKMANDADVKTALQPKTMWCADGDICSIPPGKNGIQWDGGLKKISQDVSGLTILSDKNIIIKKGLNDVTFKDDSVEFSKNKALHFGAGYTKEDNAGKIGYGLYSGGEAGTLDMVGGGQTGKVRVVNVYDALKLGSAHLKQDGEWLRVLRDPNDTATFEKGLAAKDFWSKNTYLAENGSIDVVAEIKALKNKTKNLNNDGNLTYSGNNTTYTFDGSSMIRMWNNAETAPGLSSTISVLSNKTKHWNEAGNYVGYGEFAPAQFKDLWENSVRIGTNNEGKGGTGTRFRIVSDGRYGTKPSVFTAYDSGFRDTTDGDWSKLHLERI